MSVKGMVRWSILFALALMLMTASLALATPSTRQSADTPTAAPEAPGTPGSSPTTTPGATGTLQPEASPTATREPTSIPQPGSNPDAAVEPRGTWLFIAPNASQWYKMNDAGLQLDIWLDANGQTGLSLAIYAPDQKDLYGKPIGRGSFNKFELGHDLFWTGYTTARGTWYAVVTNGAPQPISYRLDYKRVINSVAGRCSECHGFEIEWDRCVDGGSDWCEELQEEYR